MFNHTQKNDVEFRETLPLIWALSAFSVNARVLLRPLAPLLPTQLRCDWLPSLERARASGFDQAYGGVAGVRLRRCFPELNRK